MMLKTDPKKREVITIIPITGLEATEDKDRKVQYPVPALVQFMEGDASSLVPLVCIMGNQVIPIDIKPSLLLRSSAELSIQKALIGIDQTLKQLLINIQENKR